MESFKQEGRGASKRLKRREVGEPGKKPPRGGAAGGTRGLSQQEQTEGRQPQARPSEGTIGPLLLATHTPGGSAEGRKGEKVTV